ncbi:Protein-tyrosine/Dual-specificity phosphatase [Penicillium bovifimosum]|uniref:Protein-tyrosine/Dual-specificity phosphatase n=1 Tax=Penicillium bovifimosum TaxID=126998 RepID=A0A9W9L2P4_9EURO|nr:Protein-tyrosine/Dual-specificity phosphatase [Penicillium bovifimosum]KAJ5135435.1 Protein-tyrosine/Dual-specificity phosphatase [Penicillium bovifimosum]
MSQNGHSHYVRTQEYTAGPAYARPSGPLGTSAYYGAAHSAVPDIEAISTRGMSTHDFAEGDFVSERFSNHVDLGGSITPRSFSPSQWTYAMRHQAQSVLPFLYLGSSACLRDKAYMLEEGFTLLLAVRSRHSFLARFVSGDKAAAELGIMADTVDVMDHQELISAFPRAIRRINDHLDGTDLAMNGVKLDDQQPKRKVLVFCESGNERSAGVVVAYLMVMLGINHAQSAQLVQQRRFSVAIEDDMKCILVAFEHILSAKRDVERAKQTPTVSGFATLAPPPQSQTLSKKRSFRDRIMDDDDDDDDMAVDGDGIRFDERMPSAPFQDRAF